MRPLNTNLCPEDFKRHILFSKYYIGEPHTPRKAILSVNNYENHEFT